MKSFQAQVESWDIDKIIPYPMNNKKHPEEQISKIASSMAEYGVDVPIVVDGDGVIIKGHGRRLGAIKLGLNGFNPRSGQGVSYRGQSRCPIGLGYGRSPC